MAADAHVHLWDTERVEDVTYTPPASFDNPWVIRMCVAPGRCDAIKVTRTRLSSRGREEFEVVYVPEVEGV